MAEDQTRSTIPPEHWIPHPVSDHGDLDRPMPLYPRDLTGDAKAEFEGQMAEEKQAAEPEKKPRNRSRRRKGGKR